MSVWVLERRLIAVIISSSLGLRRGLSSSSSLMLRPRKSRNCSYLIAREAGFLISQLYSACLISSHACARLFLLGGPSPSERLAIWAVYGPPYF